MGLRGDWVGNALTNKLLRVGIHHCPCAWKDDCSGLQLLPSSWSQLAVGASRNRHQTGNRWRDAQWSNHRACTTPTMQQRCVGWDALEALEAILRTAAAAAFQVWWRIGVVPSWLVARLPSGGSSSHLESRWCPGGCPPAARGAPAAPAGGLRRSFAGQLWWMRCPGCQRLVD